MIGNMLGWVLVAYFYNPRKAEIRRIVVPGQPGQKSLSDPISKEKKLSMVVDSCHSVMLGSQSSLDCDTLSSK
jgi:hypothetical protein